MPITLYDAFAPSCRQVLESLAGLLDKAETHCAANGVDPEELIGARLAPDMHDFAYQVKSCLVHSAMAIEGCRAGACSPDLSDAPRSFAGLRALVADAIARLDEASPDEMEALIDRPVRFTYGEVIDWQFTADQFLLSFSQPNFYFHAATAYDLLRLKGVAIGKRDFLGALRMSV